MGIKVNSKGVGVFKSGGNKTTKKSNEVQVSQEKTNSVDKSCRIQGKNRVFDVKSLPAPSDFKFEEEEIFATPRMKYYLSKAKKGGRRSSV